MIYLCFTFFCKAWCVSIWRIGHCYIDIIRFDLQFTKKKCYYWQPLHFSHNFVHFSSIHACFISSDCSVKSSTHSTPARLRALSNKKENADFFLKRWLCCFVYWKPLKTSTKIYHQSEDRRCSSIALQARTLLSWPTQSTALNGTG